MMNFLQRCVSGIGAADFIPPVCGKIAGKFRTYLHLAPPQKRTSHYRYLPLDYHPDFVLDIGAATGFTGYAALQSFDKIPVCCIEPIAENFTILQKTLAAFPECSRASAYNLAISDRAGEMGINVTSSQYSNSLFDLPESYRKDNPDILVTEKRKIQVETLDSFSRIHKQEGHGLVKIDVEGAELNVLSGGETFIREHVSAIILELAFNRGYSLIGQVMDKLSEYDFLLYNVFDIFRSAAPENRLIQMDAVYLKKNIVP